MPQVVSAAPVLDLAVVTDPDADPIDLDEVLLDFVEKIVSRRLSQRKTATPIDAPAVGLSIYNLEQ